MRKTAYDYAHERAELLKNHMDAAESGPESPFWQGVTAAAGGAVIGGGLGLLASYGRIPLPKMKAVAYGASIGSLLGGVGGVADTVQKNRQRAKAEEFLSRPEDERDRYLASVARAEEIRKRESMAWDRQFHQDLRSDLRRYYF